MQSQSIKSGCQSVNKKTSVTVYKQKRWSCYPCIAIIVISHPFLSLSLRTAYSVQRTGAGPLQGTIRHFIHALKHGLHQRNARNVYAANARRICSKRVTNVKCIPSP